MSDYFLDQIEQSKERIPTLEHMLATGLCQPFNNVNSGPRKIMFGVHRSHVFPMLDGEKAIIETGYEIRYGDRSSSVLKTDSDYRVIAKISKFSFSPNHHYYLIVEDMRAKRLDVIERISYLHVTENYGYLYNNMYIDTVKPGDVIPNDTIVQKSLAFDEYNNRKDGINFDVAYMSLDQNMEDSIIISDVAANKMTSPLIKPVSIMINENNIPLNLYGDNDKYKCIPDIGEEIKDSILIALRKEKKEEIIFTESVDRLRTVMMSDEKKLLTGRVIDVNIYCNNPENLKQYHNGQFLMYYNELQRMSQEFVSVITPYEMNGYEISYDLKKLYSTSKRVLNNDLYYDKKTFSNIILDIVVLEENKVREGDKISNRYGGKGVISKIVPADQMPRYDGKPIDVIFNSYTMYNRENPGQIFELSINHIGHNIVKYIESGKTKTIEEAYDLIYKFLHIIVPEQEEDLRETVEYMTPEERTFFLESIIKDGNIQISTKPITDSFDIDRLALLYKTFPWIGHQTVEVPIRDSNGKLRFIEARRKAIIAKEYIYRLKQFAEEKFSATSLSATNIQGQNTKSKANKNYTELFSNTPIRFGNMEINNFNHMGAEVVVENLMIHSVSPHGRKLVEQMYTSDPYTIDIKLDKESTNRCAEVVQTYLKTIGLRLVFEKVPKRTMKLVIDPFYFEDSSVGIEPFEFIPEEVYEKNIVEEYLQNKKDLEEAKANCPDRIKPFVFAAYDPEKRNKLEKLNEIAYLEKDMNPRERLEFERKLKAEGFKD